MFSRIEYSVTARTTPEKLWEAFSDLNRLLNRGIYSEATWTEGKPWEKGSRLRYGVMQPRPAAITAVVTLAEPPYRITLLNHALGVTAEQVVTFTKAPNGLTRVTMAVDFVGRSQELAALEVTEAIQFLTHDALDTMLERWQQDQRGH
ncbi:MAG TPA: SRPBCC family protein [Terriglobales bacterium]|nr:SRPBCC family protein [Terriglobales bacterium]